MGGADAARVVHPAPYIPCLSSPGDAGRGRLRYRMRSPTPCTRAVIPGEAFGSVLAIQVLRNARRFEDVVAPRSGWRREMVLRLSLVAKLAHLGRSSIHGGLIRDMTAAEPSFNNAPSKMDSTQCVPEGGGLK